MKRGVNTGVRRTCGSRCRRLAAPPRCCRCCWRRLLTSVPPPGKGTTTLRGIAAAATCGGRRAAAIRHARLPATMYDAMWSCKLRGEGGGGGAAAAVPRRSGARVARLGGGCALYGRSVSRVFFKSARAGWQPRGWRRSRRRRWRQRGGRGSGGTSLCAGTTVSHLHSMTMCCACPCCSFSRYLFCAWRLPRSIFFGCQAPRLFVALAPSLIQYNIVYGTPLCTSMRA